MPDTTKPKGIRAKEVFGELEYNDVELLTDFAQDMLLKEKQNRDYRALAIAIIRALEKLADLNGMPEN